MARLCRPGESKTGEEGLGSDVKVYSVKSTKLATLHALPRFVVVGSFDFLGGFFSSLYPSFAFGSSEEIDLCVERERKNEWEDVEEWVKRL